MVIVITTTIAITMPVTSGQIELAGGVTAWPVVTLGAPASGLAAVGRGFLVNSTANGVTSAATASSTPMVLAHHGMAGRQGSSSSSRFGLRCGRAEASTTRKAMTAMPSAADRMMAAAWPLTPMSAWSGPRAKVPRACSPVTVTASRTATAAARGAPATRRLRPSTGAVRESAGRGGPGRIAVPLRSDPHHAPGRRGSSGRDTR